MVRVVGDGIVAMGPEELEYDVVVAGGTLGLMLAATLQCRGFKVRGRLGGLLGGGGLTWWCDVGTLCKVGYCTWRTARPLAPPCATQVCVLDKRLIEGRTQEWNISRGELKVRGPVHLGTAHRRPEGCSLGSDSMA